MTTSGSHMYTKQHVLLKLPFYTSTHVHDTFQKFSGVASYHCQASHLSWLLTPPVSLPPFQNPHWVHTSILSNLSAPCSSRGHIPLSLFPFRFSAKSIRHLIFKGILVNTSSLISLHAGYPPLSTVQHLPCGASHLYPEPRPSSPGPSGSQGTPEGPWRTPAHITGNRSFTRVSYCPHKSGEHWDTVILLLHSPQSTSHKVRDNQLTQGVSSGQRHGRFFSNLDDLRCIAVFLRRTSFYSSNQQEETTSTDAAWEPGFWS